MKQQLPEKYCPQCGGYIKDWKVIFGNFGESQHNGLCKQCNIVLKNREPPEITEGKMLEYNGNVKDVHSMDKRITSLPCLVQIGILRQRQGYVE